ncbi:MAG: ASKHA domain-containing protein, partial [Candidatus Bathyarchaeota archaeon]|nr:ASKHA domain-containing protein [Candidatus Bathyarchaeota archaeon]
MNRGITIIEAVAMMGAEIASICGGNQACGKCKVIIKTEEGSTSPLTPRERQLLTEEEIQRGLRLACAARVLGDVTVVVPEESRRGRQRLQTEGIETPVEVDPFVKKITLRFPEPTISAQEPDEDLFFDAMWKLHGYSGLELRPSAARNLSEAIREGGGIVTVYLFDGREVIEIEAGSTSERVCGFAMDVGTSKLACYLVDLSDGATLGVGSMMNPQIQFGEDVISRITQALEKKEGLKELHECVVLGINQMIREVCAEAGVSQREVYEMTMVGNTAMHHLFLDVTPRSLAFAPYTPAFSDPVDVEAGELGIDINPAGNVHALPVIAGFVGSDCVADVLATGVDRSEDTSFLIDVGTNTEIVVAREGELAACSCASGPAFEGAHIGHGMRAASGAVERVWIEEGTMEVRYLTIDDVAPRGICGSGIVDLLAEMLRVGAVDSTGR